jgi:hypothetical protein
MPAFAWKLRKTSVGIGFSGRDFWNVAPCNQVISYRRFRGVYCLNHHPEAVITSETSVNNYQNNGATSQKTVHHPEAVSIPETSVNIY